MQADKRNPRAWAAAGASDGYFQACRLDASEVTPKPAFDQAYARQIEAVHRLGPRVIGELLLEVAAGADLLSRLAIYAGLNQDWLHALHGDRFPAPPIREVA